MSKLITKFLLIFVFLVAPTSYPAFALQLSASNFDLRSILEARLALMPYVARYKWDGKLPIEDVDRESIILARTVEQAAQLGIDRAYAETMVNAQMTAAKMIQMRHVAIWQLAPEEAETLETKDLITEIRPEISELTARLLSSVAELKTDKQRCAAHYDLTERTLGTVTDEEWQIAIDGLIGPGLVCDPT